MAFLTVKAGSVRVRVYDVAWHGRPAWEVRDHFGGRGQTQRRKFASKVRALSYARQRAALLASGAGAVLRLTPAEAQELEEASKILAPLGKTVLELALEARARAASDLGRASTPLPVVVDELLTDKRRQGLSELHLRDLTARLHKLAFSFPGPIGELARDPLSDWLNQLPVGPRTWNNYRDAIWVLAEYSKARRYLPRPWDELSTLPPRKLKRRRITIFSAAEILRLLGAAGPRLLPAFAIQAFAGLRSSEIERLQWSDLKFEKGYLFLREDITKTNRPRTVPILPNLGAWLEPWANGAAGPVCRYANFHAGKSNLAKRLGLAWSRNILRDCYISYRVAALADVAAVSLEAGNSPAMILRHYLELTTPTEAARYFDVFPQGQEQNILALQFR